MEAATHSHSHAADSAFARLRVIVGDYFEMTKPRVQLLLLWTTVTTMLVAGEPSLKLILLTCLGGALSAGGAGAINHYVDRDIDAQMARTARRPVPSGRVAPEAALAYGIFLGTASMAVLLIGVNELAALLSLCGLLGYVFVYTLWLKRRTPQNIVGWAAVTGSLSLTAWLLFLIVFMWTPPHFWALSLLIRDEYAASSVPMLPVVSGVESTTRHILVYSVLLVATTLIPVATGAFGALYAVVALALGAVFIGKAFGLTKNSERTAALSAYLFSMVYLALLFAAMVFDKWI